MGGVAAAVVILYCFLGFAILSLLVAPAMLVKRAFHVRPLQRKYRKLQQNRELLPKGIQSSALYKWFKVEEERFHNTRTTAMVTLTIFAVVVESPVLLRGFNVALPTNLDQVNAFFGALSEYIGKTYGQIGINVLDFIGDAIGTPVRIAKDKLEASLRQARDEHEAAVKAAEEAAKAPPSASMINFYEELDIKPNCQQEELEELLEGFRRKWERREQKGDPKVQEKARRMLDLIDEGRGILLDPARRTDYDRKLGLRGDEDKPVTPKKKAPVDARALSDETLKHIEEMKRRRKAEKAAETGGTDNSR